MSFTTRLADGSDSNSHARIFKDVSYLAMYNNFNKHLGHEEVDHGIKINRPTPLLHPCKRFAVE